jgi:hypothetical protein
MIYQLLPNNLAGQPAQCIKRIVDNAWIPFDPANQDFVEYNKWLSEGGVPLPADE